MGMGDACTICCNLLSPCFSSLTLTEQSENKSNAGCSVSSDIHTAQTRDHDAV